MTNTDNLPASRDGRFRAVSRDWDHNGSALVDVLDMRPGDIRSVLVSGGSRPAIRAARAVARRTDTSGRVRWTRLESVKHGPSGTIRYRFTVSRLDPEHR